MTREEIQTKMVNDPCFRASVKMFTMIHFPQVEFSDSTSCRDCADYTTRVCKGEGRSGFAVIDCMARHCLESSFNLG